MKNLFKLLLLCLFTINFTACKDHIPEVEELPEDKINFTYQVSDDVYQLDYYVGATIKFYPTRPVSTDCVWNFGDGSEAVVGDTVYHKFTTAGRYVVTLNANEATKTNEIYISDIKPIVTLIQYDSLCEVMTSYISFEVELPNPDNLEAEYQWTFPEGTTNEAGEAVASFVGLPEDLGKVKFAKVGSQTVSLQVVLGGRNLEVVKKNVQVALDTLAPTLYYATVGGNIMAVKIPATPTEGVVIEPYDMGVSAGQHMFNILCHENKLYCLDAGKQYYYVNDVDGVMGDGQITIMAADASTIETMISNVGGPAFQDPFFGFIDNGNLYYSDRNTGLITVPLSTRNATYSAAAFPYWLQNNTLGYYGKGLSYGAISSNLIKIDDTYYWGKIYNGIGIWRFKAGDILAAADDKAPAPASGAVLSNLGGTSYPKSFIYNPTTQDFFFTLCGTGEGFYKCTIAELEGIKDTKTLPAAKTFADGNGCTQRTPDATNKDFEGTSSEPVGITQLAIDEVTGRVYFALRSGSSSVKSGIVYYDPATDKLHYLVEDVDAYGVTINTNPSKLF
ncbi:MAG: PKD domain-containing protein [Paludibacteraceae bacterium]|nr:PKD domain-containing protein [Paludibacteraceae bacterium]